MFTIIQLIIIEAYTKIYYRVNSNATSTLAGWRHHANDFATLHLKRSTEEEAMSRNVVSCAEPVGQGNHFQLIPTAQVESQHSVGVPTCRDFPRFVIHFA